MPLWYRLNHSGDNPNLELGYAAGKVQWVASKPISKGTELTFDYGEVAETGFA
jgi:hypothetical protein